ncbi:putative methyltransferase-domain-containing protein [Fomitopsis betulina]|nr:putative methyltransferase-domain-containing protein [Fomitopsis betulina]
MSDPEDVLGESLQSLYDYTPITHSSAGATFTYTYLGREPGEEAGIPDDDALDTPLTITLTTPDTQPANWALHASSIWVSALYLADHVHDLHLDQHLTCCTLEGPRLRVLELGAGAGLPGILVARLFPEADVVTSDYPDDELISTLADNVQKNEVFMHCHAIPYAWGTDPSPLFAPFAAEPSAQPGFDVVLAADTLWNPESHTKFLSTLSKTLRKTPDARVHLIAGYHTGRYTVENFMKAVPDVELEVEDATERQVGGNLRRPWSVQRAEEETEEERRRWVLWLSLKWKREALKPDM